MTPEESANTIAEAVWQRLEDCFDSEESGPWLRDMTLRFFNRDKIKLFIPDALFDINVASHPQHALLADFTTPEQDGSPNVNQSLLVQGTLVYTIRHLMRAYVEQPDLRGASIVYEDRRDYLQRWQSIYQMELTLFEEKLHLWKRLFMNLGKSSLLIGSKAGRLYGPAGLRTRNAGRGYPY